MNDYQGLSNDYLDSSNCLCWTTEAGALHSAIKWGAKSNTGYLVSYCEGKKDPLSKDDETFSQQDSSFN